MAITINGTANTVAGLAVGGLPDGTVDEDTLATNAVSKVKVKDDAIGVDELHATSGSAGTGTFFRGDGTWQEAGGGKVLQIQYTSVAAANSNEENNNTTDGSWEPLTKPTVVITPAATSSKIMVQLNIYAGFDQNDSATEIELLMRLIRSQSGQSDVIVGSGLWNTRAEHDPSGGWTAANAMIQMLHVDTSFPNTNAVTYSFTSKLEKDTDSCRFHLGDSHSGNGTTLIATEFA